MPYLYNKTYYDWMVGFTYNSSIAYLSLDCYKQTKSHKNETLEQYLNGIIHEIVHIMHHSIRQNKITKNRWFDEALATNLSKQNYKITPITCTLKELNKDFNSIKKQYAISYTIGKYLLENYSHEFILEICKDESILDEFGPKLFNNTKQYVEEQINLSNKK